MEKMSAARRRTDRVIRECFLRLLEERSLNNITVQELCVEAEINRATFYRYYTDVYALYDSITQSFFDKLFTDIVNRQTQISKNKDRVQQGVRAALVLIEQQKSLCYRLFHDVDSAFSFHLLNKIREVVAQEKGALSETESLRISYMCGGILSVILEWSRNDCQLEKETVAQVIEHGVRETIQSHG